MKKLKGLEPERVFYFFEAISQIPRGSGNEKAVSDYIMAFARSKGLWASQDEANNVFMKKPGTIGQEMAPAVILQGHLDMVCEKNRDTVHDFLNDPLKLVVEGDFITAEGTTLGADNGIAVAMILAVLDAEDIAHPPIEAIFTTGEEVGMDGARVFAVEQLSGKVFLNLDTEEEGHLVASCCGGVRVTLHLKAEREKAPEEGFLPVAVRISGLKGGHSGSDIHLQRPNANKLMGRILLALERAYDFFLVQVNGGLMDNAIARECEMVVMIRETDFADFQTTINSLEKIFLHEYAGADEGITVTITKLEEAVKLILNQKTAGYLAVLLLEIPDGVITKSIAMEGLVESSTNLGIVQTTEEEILFTSAVRSSVGSRKAEIADRIRVLGALAGASITERGGYPAWEFRPQSKLLELCKETYKELFGIEAKVDAIHAGLECGLFSGKLPEVEMISFGPEMHDVHTPEERLSISSTARTWEYLKAILKKMK